jgi:hypothetical protein
VIAFLGAALGTVAACLAVLVWSHADLTATFSNVPWSDIGLLVIGMPLIGAAAAWLLGGRQPPSVSRQPLEGEAPGTAPLFWSRGTGSVIGGMTTTRAKVAAVSAAPSHARSAVAREARRRRR